MPSPKNLITKTDFVRYTKCPLYAWLSKNRRDLLENQKPSRIAQQGHDVEEISHQLFETPSEKGVEVPYESEDWNRDTKELMENGTNVIYQASVLTNKYLCRADILVRDKDEDMWHLYEVKSSTQIKNEHYPDIAFQLNAFNEAGIKIKTTNIVLVNNEYVFDEKKGIEPKKFLKIIDLTEEINMVLPALKPSMKQAHKILTKNKEPKVNVLLKNLPYNPPKEFQDYYYKDLPNYSIYDLNNATRKKLAKLAAKKITLIKDIPEDYFSSIKIETQIRLTKDETSFIDNDAIKEELAQLEYPLYFLDYETINPGIPMFNKTIPYQQIPVQYSLHVIDKPGAKVRHKEFLHTEKTNPIPHILKSLKEHISPTGSVIVWNKSFEAKCNRDMAKTLPEYSDFLESINTRLYDLMLIFKDKYLDYRTKGSASLKAVVPVLIPELDYGDLEIQEGGLASDRILDLIEGKVDEGEQEKLVDDLKKYCKRDTLTMVEIFKVLEGLG